MEVIKEATELLILKEIMMIKKLRVIRLEYDPNRTCFIALIKYEDGELSYIIAPQKLKVSDTVISGAEVDIKPGVLANEKYSGRNFIT